MKLYRELKKDEAYQAGDLVVTKECMGICDGTSSFKDIKDIKIREVSVDDTANTFKGSISKKLRKFADFVDKK